jgi:hypothetical protein
MFILREKSSSRYYIAIINYTLIREINKEIKYKTIKPFNREYNKL